MVSFHRCFRQVWVTLCLSLAVGGASAASWVVDGRPTPTAVQAVAILQNAAADGLEPDDYQVRSLGEQLTALTAQPNSLLALSFEQQLNEAMVRFLRELKVGRVSAREVHQHFDATPVKAFDARAHLAQALANDRLSVAVADATPQFPLYPALKRVLSRYRDLSGSPAWQVPLPVPAGNKLEPGQPYSGLVNLQDRLIALGDLPPTSMRSAVYDAVLVQALKAFQQRHGLESDGVLGRQTLAALNTTPSQRVAQIALSMERVRWTPLQQGERRIVVNVPGFMLYGYTIRADHGIDIQVEMKVVIGRALDHRTPLFDEEMRFIEFSPYWNIPASIARHETIPALRRDPGYLARHEMEFVDRQGHVSTQVTPSALSAVLAGDWRIRQRPGVHNALGDIKFIFPNNQNIYMHHTPATQLFERSRRDFSHGCIRVEKPVALAQFVLANAPDWSEARIRNAMATGRSSTIRLREPIPVVIGYSTVMVRGGTVYFYPDVYGHDQTLAAAIERARGQASSKGRVGT